MHEVKDFESLVKVIKETMDKRGVTQKELAQAIGVLQPQINRVLQLKNSPSISLVFKICGYLKVTLAAGVPNVVIDGQKV